MVVCIDAGLVPRQCTSHEQQTPSLSAHVGRQFEDLAHSSAAHGSDGRWQKVCATNECPTWMKVCKLTASSTLACCRTYMQRERSISVSQAPVSELREREPKVRPAESADMLLLTYIIASVCCQSPDRSQSVQYHTHCHGLCSMCHVEIMLQISDVTGLGEAPPGMPSRPPGIRPSVAFPCLTALHHS